MGQMTFCKTSAVRQNIDLVNKNKVVCRMCWNKLTYNYSTQQYMKKAADASTANVSHTANHHGIVHLQTVQKCEQC